MFHPLSEHLCSIGSNLFVTKPPGCTQYGWTQIADTSKINVWWVYYIILLRWNGLTRRNERYLFHQSSWLCLPLAPVCCSQMSIVEKDTIIPLASLSYLLIRNFLQILTDIVYVSVLKVKPVLKNVHTCITHSLPVVTCIGHTEG